MFFHENGSMLFEIKLQVCKNSLIFQFRVILHTNNDDFLWFSKVLCCFNGNIEYIQCCILRLVCYFDIFVCDCLIDKNILVQAHDEL